MRARPGACESVRAPSSHAASRAPLTRRARVPSVAVFGDSEELLRTSLPPSWTRSGRFSCRWVRKVRAGPYAQLALHARLEDRACRSRPLFGARAPRSASHRKRCPVSGAHARSRPTRMQVKVTAKSTASLVELTLEVLLHAGFFWWRSGTCVRSIAARRPPRVVRSATRSLVDQSACLVICSVLA